MGRDHDEETHTHTHTHTAAVTCFPRQDGFNKSTAVPLAAGPRQGKERKAGAARRRERALMLKTISFGRPIRHKAL